MEKRKENSSLKLENNKLNIEYTDIISDIRRATVDSKHPYRYAALSTVNQHVGVQSRTVVLRKLIENNQLLIYTDSRTEKIEDISYDNRVSILCYHPKRQHQLRIKGTATRITHGDLYDECLKKISSRGIRDYNTASSPGCVINDNEELSRDSSINFSLISIQFQCLDFLAIRRPDHYRVRFKMEEGTWSKQRLIP